MIMNNYLKTLEQEYNRLDQCDLTNLLEVCLNPPGLIEANEFVEIVNVHTGFETKLNFAELVNYLDHRYPDYICDWFEHTFYVVNIMKTRKEK